MCESTVVRQNVAVQFIFPHFLGHVLPIAKYSVSLYICGAIDSTGVVTPQLVVSIRYPQDSITISKKWHVLVTYNSRKQFDRLSSIWFSVTHAPFYHQPLSLRFFGDINLVRHDYHKSSWQLQYLTYMIDKLISGF